MMTIKNVAVSLAGIAKPLGITAVLLALVLPCVAQRALPQSAQGPVPPPAQRLLPPPTQGALSFPACLDSFARIPSGPATRYTLELLVSIPDTAHPKSLFTWPRVRLGHVFLGLSKTTDTTSVVEYLGFYARSPLLAFTTGLPVKSRLIDNHGHPYQAGLRLRLTAGAWDTVLARLRQDAGRRYSVLSYNCVHYALDVVNSVRPRPLNPPLARIGGPTTRAYLTPNGVYILLCTMRSGPEGKEIVVRHGMAEAGEDWLLRLDTAAAPAPARRRGPKGRD